MAELQRGKGKAKGVYYKGVAATGQESTDNPPFILIAANMDDLEHYWDNLMSPTVLDRSKVYEVAMFNQTNVTEG